MPMEISDYNGDGVYSVRCTGDAVAGDEVRFDRATFAGSFRNAKFAGFERITGKIIKDRYGRDKQQHTFTLLLENGAHLQIKGRVLYREGNWRKLWPNEDDRKTAQTEKHRRGDSARAIRDERKQEQF